MPTLSLSVRVLAFKLTAPAPDRLLMAWLLPRSNVPEAPIATPLLAVIASLLPVVRLRVPPLTLVTPL